VRTFGTKADEATGSDARPSDAFICYAREHKHVIARFVEALRARETVSIKSREISPTAERRAEIRAAIEARP
jgi:hypothetical protein